MTLEQHCPLRDIVVCQCASLAQLLRTPFSEEAWECKACRFRGAVHLLEKMTEKWREDRYRQMMDPREDRTTYWGIKFPHYMASYEPGTAPDVDAELNEMDKYKVVVRNRFGSHTLVISATVKAVDPRYEPGSTQEYVVFRTNRVLSAERQCFGFKRYKLLEWWSSSLPIGAPRVMAGFRDDDGIVQSVREFQVHQIPEQAKGVWSKDVCLRFLDQFLRFLKDHVQEDDGRTVYHFEYQPRSRKVVCTRLPDTDESGILPGWYLRGHDRDTTVQEDRMNPSSSF
ncbi:decapping and exoribonuclease protein-like [Rhipicephalus microplus]|uniref:decapping and exoribonuclease protein-like n=1 Tax=Rhipicephalus microplus TaxID=6941 RepID=UPI003F6B3B08